MAERYLHSEVNIYQHSKRGMSVCGDTVSVFRQEKATYIILCDGIGSGIGAHIASKLCKARLETLLTSGYSVQDAFYHVGKGMQLWKEPGKPYAAFLIGKIRQDGYASIMGFEIPVPIWVTSEQANVLHGRTFMKDQVEGWQVNCYLRSGEGLFLFSDGISQAGLGQRLPGGWKSEGVADYVNLLLKKGVDLDMLGEDIISKASEHDGNVTLDDMTVVGAFPRHGRTLNIMTGPPCDKNIDQKVVGDFMRLTGAKVICGATTASIAARVLGEEINLEQNSTSLITPPKSYINGIDLVTEGAITLNQLNNVLDVDSEEFDEVNAVTDFYDLLMGVDRVRFFVGSGKNKANTNICFVQQGVLCRETVIPRIAEKLRAKGKCVLVKSV